jgi:hypothetical protein
MKFNLQPKLVEKLVWVPIISFCKIFIPNQTFDALLCQTIHSCLLKLPHFFTDNSNVWNTFSKIFE